jgi:helicase
MSRPELHVDYAQAENASTSMARHARGLTASWEQLLANAQAVLGVYANAALSRDGSHATLYNETEALPLIAAARILNTAWSHLPTTSLADNERDQMRLLASLAFAMYGNAPSAHAAASEIQGSPESLSPESCLAAAIAVPRKLGYYMRGMPLGSRARVAAQALAAFLATGSEEAQRESDRTFIEALKNTTALFDVVALRAARLAIQHLGSLSLSRTLRPLSADLPAGYIDKLIDDQVLTLLPPQYQIVSQGLLSTFDNSLVALPTSTGKTLVGEMCLARALSTQPGLVCFVAPYVAIGRQVAESLRRHLPDQCRVHSMFGMFATDGGLQPRLFQEVVVATPERLDGLLRGNPSLYDHLRCVVVDEAHLIENGSRGLRLEGVLTRLRLKQQQGVPFRIVCLSAVLGSYSALARWLAIPSTAIFSDAWKPTARRLAFWSETGRLTWFQGSDPLRRANATTFTPIATREVPWPEQNIRASANFAAIQRDRPKSHQNVAYMADLAFKEFGGTVLCVCATKSATRSLARALVQRFPELQPLPPELETAIVRLLADFPHLGLLANMLRHGVAFHNAALPQPVRFLIEDAIKERCMCAIAATTTLAEGVDLPFRTTILADWLVGFGDQQRPMSPLMFRNIAGRCGRAGVFTEGDTIIFDNPLGNERFTVGQRWLRMQESLLSQPTELESAIAIQGHGPHPELDAALSSQFLAAIPENPDDDDLMTHFTSASYAAQRPSSNAKIAELMPRIRRYVLDPANGPFAVAASPIQLTPLGEAASLAGFAPSSCRTILGVLDQLPPPASEPELAATLLVKCSSLPEQSNRNLRQVVDSTRSKFCVKPSDFAQVVADCLAGKPRAEIFVSLPFVHRSQRATPITEWQAGRDTTDTWGSEFDKFDEFVVQAIEGYLPWLCRACTRLSAHSQTEWVKNFDWEALAARLEVLPDRPEIDE